jgi:predicted nucleic acid-binding protein
VIFVDSNIPMYLIGADHPNKHAARLLLERAVIDGESLVTDAEVLQEILHRYVAINRRDAIAPAFDAILGVVDAVHPIEVVDAQQARALIEGEAQLSARDALHVAVMERRSIRLVMSFDRGFDGLPGLVRLGA